MYKTKYECEVITPMFLRGEDRKNLELRAPAIKGALRFWWRALHGYLDEDELRQRERFLFGGIGEDSRKSTFSIRVKPIKIIKKKFSFLPHKEDYRYKKNAFLSGTKFEVEFIVNTYIYNEKKRIKGEDVILEIENLFEIVSILGGLGMRARRGFGSFRIVKKNGGFLNEDFSNIKNIKEKIDAYAKDKYVIKKSINNLKIIESIETKVNTAIKQIILSPLYYKDEKVLTYNISNLSHKSRHISYYEGLNITERQIENSLGGINLGKKNKERFASPIYISAIKGKNGLSIVITKLSAEASNSIQDKFISGLLK